jgi:hypothetical protein
VSPDRRVETPSGQPPPTEARLTASGQLLDLAALAREVCRRYRAEYPDEAERYGDAGNAWCVHDNQHLLNWAAGALNGYVDMEREVGWLARVLEARDFPIDRLARNLDIGAEVVREQVGGEVGNELGSTLAGAASFVRSRETFL